MLPTPAPSRPAATASACAAHAPSPPRVLVPSCNRLLGEHPFHVAGGKYIDAVRLAGGLPLVVPPVSEAELESLLALADGVLLTGSPSNVHPSHFGQAVHDPSLPLDPQRDAWTLPLVRRALAMGLPLLAICRGAQEVNVALGGTLHQAVQEQPGFADHRARELLPAAEQYAPVHAVRVLPGGLLETLLPGQTELAVNSLHGQGVRDLASGLRAEALAPDGLIEAFSLHQPRGFALCLQWHPEWQAAGNPVSMAVLRAFGRALVDWRDRVRGPLPPGESPQPAPVRMGDFPEKPLPLPTP